MRIETKTAVLEGGVECTNLVAFSVYDTKPVNFFLWQLITWRGTSMNRISMTRQLIKKVKLHFHCTEM